MGKTVQSIQVLRERRRRAEDWIEYAAWTAMVTGVLGSIAVVVIAFVNHSAISQVVPVLSTLIAQAIVGYNLKDRSTWAAWALMVSYLASVALTLFVYGVWSGLLLKLAIGFIYVRGWLGTIDYDELTKQINEATSKLEAGDAT